MDIEEVLSKMNLEDIEDLIDYINESEEDNNE